MSYLVRSCHMISITSYRGIINMLYCRIETNTCFNKTQTTQQNTQTMKCYIVTRVERLIRPTVRQQRRLQRAEVGR